jgi:hypothetical protein
MAASEGNHGGRKIHSEYVVTGGSQFARQDAATAPHIDHKTCAYSIPSQDGEQSRRGAPGEIAEAGVVYVR